MSRKRASTLGQELTRQLFGCPRKPLRHLGKSMVRGSLDLANAIIQDVLGSVVGLGRTSRKRRR